MPALVGRVTLTAAVLAAACGTHQDPTAPSLAKGGSAPSVFSAAPATVEFTVPPGGSEVITVTVQYLTTVTSSSSNTGCATVSPTSTPTKKPKGSSAYIATFTVSSVAVGTCTITLADKNGKTATVLVSVLTALPDRIVYTSGVNGTSDVYIMDLDGQNKTRLTATPDVYDILPQLSADGRKVRFITTNAANTIWTAYQIAPDGTGLTALALTGLISNPTYSPDGKRVAFADYVDTRSRIFTSNLDGTNRIQLTFGTSAPTEGGPSWSGPLPGRIAFVREAARNLWIMNADGTNQFQVTADDDPWLHGPTSVALSPDGLRIAFDCQPTTHVYDVCIINADGTGRTQLSSVGGNNYAGRWTRDGRIVFTHRGDDKNEEIYIMNADGTNQTNLTNSAANESTTSPRPPGV